MLLGRNVIPFCLLILWLSSTRAICPTFCICKIDEKSRRKVSCLQGGMYDPIPITEMDIAMEILEISGPPSNWNELTLGPIFQGFKKLQELYIWRSSVVQIGMHPFWGVPSLKVLSLRHNNISVINDHNFRGLANLVELHLDDNKIVSIPAAAFRHLTELRILTLERNFIEELVPRMFVKLTKLQVLKLSGNPFHELDPEAFKDILELRVLECRGCGLRRINTQIYHLLPSLTHLDLGKNKMQYLDAEEFIDLHKLRSLKLDGNMFPVILERTFVHQVHLKFLHLSRNRLAKITNTAFLNLTSLIELDIGYNRLPRLETISLQPVANTIQKLILSGNKISPSLLKVITHMCNNLKDLAAADMQIINFPEALSNNIIKLNLSGNALVNITVDSMPKKLQSLDLSRNKFVGLEEDAVQYLAEVKDVNLYNNTWTCDVCNISPLLFHANKSKNFFNITCAFPKKLSGRTIVSLNILEISNCFEEEVIQNSILKEKFGLLMGAAGILIFLLFCVAFVVFSCVRRHARHPPRDDKKEEEEIKRVVDKKETVLEPTVVFGSKGEISFKFPLDLTERKMSVSTIDEIKRDTTPIRNLPNGNAKAVT